MERKLAINLLVLFKRQLSYLCSLEKTIFHGYLSSLENTVKCKQSTRDNIQGLLLGAWLGVCLFLLLTLHYILYCIHCILYCVHCTLYSVFYTFYTVYCFLYIVHFTLYPVICCMLYILHCALYSVFYTLYIILYV